MPEPQANVNKYRIYISHNVHEKSKGQTLKKIYPYRKTISQEFYGRDMCICRRRYGKSKRLFFNSCGDNSVIAEWSTNGTNYNEFYNFVDTAT